MSEDVAAKVAARLRELWRTSKPVVLERMNVLHDAYTSLAENPANGEARSNGLEAAHKLSGVLGVFGLPQGSETASSIEFLLKSGETLDADNLDSLRRQIAELDALIASKADD
jgi:HPt (histidine-containing phosphotransfer) domain-containing protein